MVNEKNGYKTVLLKYVLLCKNNMKPTSSTIMWNADAKQSTCMDKMTAVDPDKKIRMYLWVQVIWHENTKFWQ